MFSLLDEMYKRGFTTFPGKPMEFKTFLSGLPRDLGDPIRFVAEGPAEFSAYLDKRMEYRDFGCVLPPYGHMFIEHSNYWEGPTSMRMGHHIMCPKMGPGGYFVLTNYFKTPQGVQQFVPMTIGLDEDGLVNFNSEGVGPDIVPTFPMPEHTHQALLNSIYVPLYCLSLMHYRDRVVEEIEPSLSSVFQAPTKKVKKPFIRSHILRIPAMDDILKEYRSLEKNGKGQPKAVHSVRGHKVTYTEENPLFGKHTGTYFRRPHFRGSTKEGLVLKDYELT